MNFNECVNYIQNALLFGSKKNNLENISELLSRLGNPQNRLKLIHVAGTNGKGSVCAMLESVLRVSGYKTGLFTSPYLETFAERIRLDNKNIDEALFANIANRVITQAKTMKNDGFSHPTFFEMVTACAFLAFNEQKVDIAVIETGIGGLYDSTNIIDPLLCIITNIGLDHTSILGSTIEEIARQKAGIIKPGCPVVLYPQDSSLAYTEILLESKRQSAPLYYAADAKILVRQSGLDGQKFDLNYQSINTELFINLLGHHQLLNAATAFVSCLVLIQLLKINITPQSITDGFKKALWPGRLEILKRDNPLIIVDGAHNRQAAKMLKDEIKNLIVNQKCVLLIGIMSTKDAEGIIEELSEITLAAVATSPFPPKSLPADELEVLLKEKCDAVFSNDSVELALQKAIHLAKKEKAPLLVAGSLYLAGKIRTLVLKN